MKNTIINLIAVVAVSFGSAAFAAGEIESKAQPAAVSAPAASEAPPATVTEPTSAAPAEQLQPTAKRAKAKKRPKDMDLRHCLELDNNLAIARCAYE